MNRGICKWLLIVAAVSLLCVAVRAEPIPVGPDEAALWARYLVPLPRSLSITAKLRLDPRTVAVCVPAEPDIVVDEARKELWESMGLPETHSNPPNPAFTLTLQIGGPESAPLVGLKNSDQAYLIFPEAGHVGLRIVALSSRGLYYGAKTVEQLVAARASESTIEMPIINVTDWPELRDRGVWGNDSFNWTRWMADRKMNYQEQLSSLSFDSNCVGHGASRTGGYEKILTEGPYYALEPCLAILHLEQLSNTGVFTCYPNLVAVNGVSGAWCYSQPQAVDVLGWWIADLGSLPYCNDVDVWMSETVSVTQGCKCPSCKLVNRNVLEARTIVSGWKRAMQAVGPIGLRILTSEKTRDDNDLLVQELASDPEVKIWHYDSLITYMVSEKPIVDPYFAAYAASGHYVGEVPQLSASTKCFGPFSSPQFVRYRMQEFQNKKISGFLGYPSPGIAYTRMNTDAAAEWSWNPDGRSVRDFALSYATRQGYADPVMFADWCELMGPVSWDVLGSEYPRGVLRGQQNCGPIADALLNETLQPLGTFKGLFPAPWGDIENLTRFNDDVANASRALDIAKRMGIPEFYYESLVQHGYITALRAVYELNSLITNKQVAPADRPAASNYFYIYVAGLKQAQQALGDWERAIAGTVYRVPITVSTLGTEISQMMSLASSLGCPIGSTFTAVPVTSIPEAKASPDGTFVSLGCEVVTSTTNGAYIQETLSAPCGIRLQTNLPLTLNQPVSVLGFLGTTNGERCINATMIIPRTSSDAVRPIAMRTRDIAGGALGLQSAVWEYRSTPSGRQLVPVSGTHNVGVRARIAGRVTAQGAGWFYVDDGCGCDDGSGCRGVRVICGSFKKPALGSFVAVTGVSSTYYDRGRTWRALVVTSPSDITTL